VSRVNELSEQVIGACIEVHRELGPGLLESAYEECVAHELRTRNITFQRQVPLPIEYKGLLLDASYRLDLVVDGCLIVEIKAVEQLQRIHEAQVLTYLKLARIHYGLLVNFNVHLLRLGLKRLTIKPQ
jgi:GxxExxY protein